MKAIHQITQTILTRIKLTRIGLKVIPSLPRGFLYVSERKQVDLQRITLYTWFWISRIPFIFYASLRRLHVQQDFRIFFWRRVQINRFLSISWLISPYLHGLFYDSVGHKNHFHMVETMVQAKRHTITIQTSMKTDTHFYKMITMTLFFTSIMFTRTLRLRITEI